MILILVNENNLNKKKEKGKKFTVSEMILN